MPPSAVGWPVALRHGAIRLRPMRRRDVRAWREVREANLEWLRPWESTSPDGGVFPTFGAMVRANNRMARQGLSLPMIIEVDGRLAGQVTLACLVWGSLRSGAVGYWIDHRRAGRGIVPLATAMLCDHAVFSLGLHRIEVNIRPENEASLRVVEKLGFRDEGLRERYLFINGAWCDHRTFALTTEEYPPGGLLARLTSSTD